MPIPVSSVTNQILVDGKQISDNPLDSELRQEWGRHELFFIRIEYPRLMHNLNALTIWPTNAPVQITWGRGSGNLSTWYGYVNHHEIKSNADSGSRATQVTYTCLGTSKPMNSENTRTWGQTSPTYMARQIFAEHSLRAVLTSTNWVSDFEIQSSESDFAFLNRMADRYGFRTFVSGGTGYFIDPAAVLAGSGSQAVPVYNLDKRFDWQDTVRDFTKIEGDNVPGSELATRLVSGVDQTTGNPFTVAATGTGGRMITKIHTGRVARSVAEAQVMADAWQSQSQFYIQATAELFGNTMVYPGKLVYLDGKALPGSSQGYWMVASARHVLKNSVTNYAVLDRYVTRVRLIRNQAGNSPNVQQISVVSPEIVPCNLTGSSVWQAASLGAYYDGVLR